MEGRNHVIGEGSNPVLILKKGELKDLFTPFFDMLYEIWFYYHNGFGLPGGRAWDEQDPDIVAVVASFEAHFNAHFETNNIMLKYREAELRRNLKG